MAISDGKVPTIVDVARLAKVGVMTVSRVINHHPSVRPTTKKKVLAAITQLGYQQNEAARLLKGQRAMTIGLIVPDLSDAFFASCAQTVQHIAREHGYMTLVAASERDADLEVQQAQLMATRKVSGLLIVTSTRKGDHRLRDMQDSGLEIVAFDRPLDGIDSDCVVVENRAGAEEGVQHLLDHGYRSIACLGYDEAAYTIHERIAGYTNRMLAAGLPLNIVTGLLTFDDICAWLAEAMKGKDSPTAIFSLNHRTSVFLLKALAEMKIKVPEQMALLGFDEFDLASVTSPPLTTIAQSPVDLANRSMALLMDRIKSSVTSNERSRAKIVLPVKLIPRSSCGEHPLHVKSR